LTLALDKLKNLLLCRGIILGNEDAQF